ncbi:histidinol dehydrogenase, partial [Striga asiatica]
TILPFLPWRVFFNSSQPLASNSRLQIPRKFSSETSSSPLKLPFELPLLATPIPFSTGITAARFHTSFNALAFNVAAPPAAVKVIISPGDRTLTAELTTEAKCSRSAPITSAASTHCAATRVAADATAMSAASPDAAAVAAAMAATADATPATDTVAWSCALWARASSFFFSLLSLSHRPTVFPPPLAVPEEVL